MRASILKAFVENPNRASFDGEDEDEKILYVLRKHLVTNVDWIFVSFLLFITPLLVSRFVALFGPSTFPHIPANYLSVIIIFWYLFTFIYVFESFLVWFFNVYIISDKRIVDMDFYGLLHRNISAAPLRNIEDVTYNISGALKVIFNYGDVLIQTAGEKIEFEFEEVGNPSRVVDILSDLVSKLKEPSE